MDQTAVILVRMLQRGEEAPTVQPEGCIHRRRSTGRIGWGPTRPFPPPLYGRLLRIRLAHPLFGQVGMLSKHKRHCRLSRGACGSCHRRIDQTLHSCGDVLICGVP